MKVFSKMNNNNGFLLAEAIVVGVFVLSLFTFLFVNVVPLVGRYESSEKYDTIDATYNANLIRAMLMEDDNLANILALNDRQAYKIYSAESLCSQLSNKKSFCKSLLGDLFLDVKYVYVTWYRTTSTASHPGIKGSIKSNYGDFDRATRDYIDSLKEFNQPSGNEYDEYHRIIISYNDGSFANIEIKV